MTCVTSRQWNIFSGLKGNELSSHGEPWRNLQCMLLSERSRSLWKATDCLIKTIWHSGKGKIMETVERSEIACQGEEDKQAEHRGYFRTVKLISMICNGGCMSLYICQNPHRVWTPMSMVWAKSCPLQSSYVEALTLHVMTVCPFEAMKVQWGRKGGVLTQ